MVNMSGVGTGALTRGFTPVAALSGTVARGFTFVAGTSGFIARGFTFVAGGATNLVGEGPQIRPIESRKRPELP
jgi:hypothetical protein